MMILLDREEFVLLKDRSDDIAIQEDGDCRNERTPAPVLQQIFAAVDCNTLATGR